MEAVANVAAATVGVLEGAQKAQASILTSVVTLESSRCPVRSCENRELASASGSPGEGALLYASTNFPS